MHPGSESEHSGLSDRLASSATRRTFMKRVIGGLAIAVPAYRVLAGAAPAEAATASGSATPNTCKGGCPPYLVAQYCAGQGPLNTGCKGPDVAACMQEWSNGVIKQEGYCYEP